MTWILIFYLASHPSVGTPLARFTSKDVCEEQAVVIETTFPGYYVGHVCLPEA